MSGALRTDGMINAYEHGASTPPPASEAKLLGRREAVLGRPYRLFYQEPVHFVRGEGVWLYDAEGQPYLDVYNNVASVGHSQPDVVSAISRQAATLNTHTRYLHETILDYAERLLATFPSPLTQAMFTCTGSEANDLAYRIAKHCTGQRGMIVTSLAYHGVTDAVAAFSPSLGAAAAGPHVRAVPAPDSYRRSADHLGRALANDVRAAITDLEEKGLGVAALICDTIFSSDGVFVDPPGFLTEAVDAVHAAGGLFIADEVQPGFGRTGKSLWGFERHGVAPDIVTMGKPMGNGQPIAGLVARADLLDSFGSSMRYFNTFGGNPVSCAAALAVLEVIERDHLMERADQVGAHLSHGLVALAQRYAAIGDVRGAGLFIGVELVSDRSARTPDPALTSRVVNGLRRKRVLISAAGPHANVLKIRPPLVFSEANADLFLDALDQTLAESAHVVGQRA